MLDYLPCHLQLLVDPSFHLHCQIRHPHLHHPQTHRLCCLPVAGELNQLNKFKITCKVQQVIEGQEKINL